MGMDPTQTTIDPLAGGPGRGFANNLFATLQQGMNQGNANGFNPSQAPAFQQLFGGGGYGGNGGKPPIDPNWKGGAGTAGLGLSDVGGNQGMWMGGGGGMRRMGGGADYWSNPSNFQPGSPMHSRAMGGPNNTSPMPGSGSRQTGAGFTGGNFDMNMQPGSPPNAGGQQAFQFNGQMPVLKAGGPATDLINGAMQNPNVQEAFGGNPLFSGGNNQGTPFGSGMDSMNMPMWGGPYGAGLTGMQMDAMSGMQQLIDGTQQNVSNDMIQGGLDQAMGGNKAFDPANGGTLQDAVQPYQMDSQAGDFFSQLFGGGGFAGGGEAGGGGSRLNDVITQIQPDLVGAFQGALNPGGAGTGQGVAAMDGAVNRAMAMANEQASGMGLAPGSLDRASLMAGGAADVAARLGVEQQNADTNSISRRNQDRVGAINSAGAFENIMNSDFRNKMAEGRLGVDALPALLASEERPFERMMGIHEPAAGRSMQGLGMLPEFRNMPFQELMQGFGMGEAGRGVADTEIQRMMNEFGRTQGGLFDRGVGALANIPGTNTAMGPSKFSQVAGAGGQGAQAYFGSK